MELFLDTTGNYLNIAMYDKELVENIHEECIRSQSENILPYIDELCKKHGYTADDITKVIITEGPGSYTGVRIAMTLAKVLCSTKHIPLYTISTLQAMALGHGKACSIIDARSNRAFVGFYEDNVAECNDSIMTLDAIKEKLATDDYVICGNGELIGYPSKEDVMNEEIFKHPECWKLVENVHTLVPVYLKEDEAYGR